jgi:hypothetical protein
MVPMTPKLSSVVDEVDREPVLEGNGAQNGINCTLLGGWLAFVVIVVVGELWRWWWRWLLQEKLKIDRSKKVRKINN